MLTDVETQSRTLLNFIPGLHVDIVTVQMLAWQHLAQSTDAFKYNHYGASFTSVDC